MNILIDTIETYSGGYLTYLKGILGSNSIPDDVTVTVCCSEKFISDLGSVDANVRFVVDKRISRSITKMVLWRTYVLPEIIKREKADLHFNPGGQLMEPRTHETPTVSVCMNLLPFKKDVRRTYPLLSRDRAYFALLAYTQSRSFRLADGVILLHEYTGETLRDFGVTMNRSVVIPFGMSEVFRGELPGNRGGTASKILYVSPIQLYKNQWHVAEAVGILRREDLDVTVMFVGNDDPMGTPLLELTRGKLGYPSWIKRKKSVHYDDMPALYQNADMFVFASSIENMPNVLIEAMASGLPIACSNIRPMTDILGDAGVYFDPTDACSIATALRTMVHDAKLRRWLGARAKERAGIYSWKKTATETFEFIRSIARRGIERTTSLQRTADLAR
jgi:glycosyltransferase involved in cell wall biosynthesis